MSELFSHLTGTYIFKDVYKIRWTRLGEPTNAAVVLIHGTPFSSLEWLPYAQALQKHYCVYLWDLAGFGASQEVVGDGTEQPRDWDVGLALQGELFASLLIHWGLQWTGQDDRKLPHVIAHDIGGHTALRAHVLHDAEYASLCLLDAVAVTPWGSPFMRSIMANPGAFESIPPDVFRGMLREYVQSAAFKTLPDHKLEEFVRPWLDGGPASMKAFLRQIRSADPSHTEEQEKLYSDVMKRDKSRLKIIWGENDAWVPIERGEKLRELTGAMEFVRVADAGHLVLVDQPEIVTYEITTWLARMV